MDAVFVVQHSHEIADCEDVKMIGVYRSRSDADAAVSRLVRQPGFREYPSGFSIDEYEIGKDHWVEGFVTLLTIMMPLLDEGIDVWRPVEAEVLPNGQYRIVAENQSPDVERWAFTTGQVVSCAEREFDGEMRLVAVPLSDEPPDRRASGT